MLDACNSVPALSCIFSTLLEVRAASSTLNFDKSQQTGLRHVCTIVDPADGVVAFFRPQVAC